MHLVPLRPVSPTVAHLKALVLRGAMALRTRYVASKARLEQRSVSRLFRPPCFREENRLLRADTHTLRCRVQLFLSLMSVFPAGYDDATRRADETASDDGSQRRPRAAAAAASWHQHFLNAFHKTLTASQEMNDSDAAYEASSDDSAEEETAGFDPSAASRTLFDSTASRTLFNHALRNWRA